MNDQVNEVFSSLTEVQASAANWSDGALMLLAGPGSGKTRVLTSRIARLFSEAPSARWRILALTFTTRAADEMRHRIEQLVPESVDRLFAGTFHSFACEVLRQSGSHVGVQTDFKIYSNAEDRSLLLTEAAADVGVRLDEPAAKIFPILDGFRDRLVAPDSCLKHFNDLDKGKKIAELYQAYIGHLQRINALDFPAIIYMAHKLFTEFPAIATRYRRTYQFTSVDEFQDTNYAQYEFVRAFTGSDYKNLFIVADDDQVIYQWNGASPQRLQQFVADYSPAVLQMPTNFRCPKEVVEMANGLVAHNLLRTAGKNPLLAGKDLPFHPGRVRFMQFASDNDEASGIAADIQKHHANSLDSIAVIARTKALLEKVKDELRKLDISAQIAQRRDNFASIPYQWLQRSLQVANRRSDIRDFGSFVESGNALFGLELNPGKLASTAGASHGDLLRAWLTSASPAAGYPSKAIDLVKSELVEKNDYKKYLRGITALFAEPEWQLEESHSSFDEDARAWRELFGDIVSVVGRDAPLDTFLQELELRSKEPPLRPGVVPLLTIHGSKGNEFSHVYVVGLAEDILPSFQSKKQGDKSPQMEEERRNCFVAITRCMDSLTLSKANSYNGWGKAPSRFLTEMGVLKPA
jgi:DNA helicase-2/ATP-dependent DNA helicase PcrA